MRHTSLIKTAFLVLLTGLAACSPTDRFEGAQSPSPKESPPPETKGRDLDSEIDQESIDEPIMVGGIYLVCQENKDVESIPGHRAAGCRVEQASERGKKAQLSAALAAEIMVWDRFNAPLPNTAVIVESTPQSPDYNWKLHVPTGELEGSRVEAKLIHKETGLYRRVIGTIDAAAGAPPSTNPPPEIKELGEVTDFHLGNDDYTMQNNQDCLKSADNPLQRVEYGGKALYIPIFVKDANTRVGITITEMCGVSPGVYDSQRRVIPVDNRVAIIDPDKKETSDVIAPKSSAFVIRGFNAQKPGKYILKISSGTVPGTRDLDDFVVGRIRFVSDGVVDVGKPWTD